MALALVTASSFAQSPLKIGLKGGITMANVTGDDTGGAESRSGIAGGVFTNLKLPGGFSIQPELLYVQKGAEVSASDSLVSATVTLQTNYIEISILLKYSFATKGSIAPCVFAGPAFSSSKGSKTKVEGSILGIAASGEVDNFNEASSDLSFVIGGGADFSLGRSKLTLEVRYTAGTKNMWEDVNVGNLPDNEMVYADTEGMALDMKHSVVSVMVGLMF